MPCLVIVCGAHDYISYLGEHSPGKHSYSCWCWRETRQEKEHEHGRPNDDDSTQAGCGWSSCVWRLGESQGGHERMSHSKRYEVSIVLYYVLPRRPRSGPLPV
jgi:hypothetical protein